MRKSILIFTQDGNTAVEIFSINRDGDKLLMDVKVLDAMRMDIMMTKEEFGKSLSFIFSWDIISYLLLYPYFILKKAITRSKASV